MEETNGKFGTQYQLVQSDAAGSNFGQQIVRNSSPDETTFNIPPWFYLTVNLKKKAAHLRLASEYANPLNGPIQVLDIERLTIELEEL